MAILINDPNGHEIIFLENGLEIHHANSKMIKIHNAFDKSQIRVFDYNTEEECTKQWEQWLKTVENNDSSERQVSNPVKSKKPNNSKPEPIKSGE